MQRIHIAVVGLGFGSAFAEIYQRHPHVSNLTVCDNHPERLRSVAGTAGVTHAYENLKHVLQDPSIDAVHLCTGIPDHARQSVEVLQAGKHCACAVPMATSLEDIHAIIAAVRSTGLNYTMMETQLFSREYLYVQKLLCGGTLGRLQFLRGMHYQNMENWPTYWAGLPPMWYATHAVAPLLALAQTRARSVTCVGSGYMREDLQRTYSNPFPIETAVFELERKIPLAMEVTRALFYSARGYSEGFSVYGDEATFEWPQVRGAPVLFCREERGERGDLYRAQDLEIPFYPERLPQELAGFACGSHGGSHPHLVHEFVSSIVEGRKPLYDEIKSADTTAAGICAHESAMRGGERIMIPVFCDETKERQGGDSL